MKRFEFLVPPRDHVAMCHAADAAGIAASEFVRIAVAEKLGRELLVDQVSQVRNDLGELVKELRLEIARTRKDLMDDSQRCIELLRQDIAKSMKKNEELNKTFVMQLAGIEPRHEKPSRPTKPSDEPPMRIPG